MNTPFWDQFKRQPQQARNVKYIDKIYFQLQRDQFGSFISVVDNKHQEVETTYLNYSGATRNMLRVLEQLKISNSHIISWDINDCFRLCNILYV